MEKIISSSKEESAIFILGPTGIGKTHVSINLALRLTGTIINTDAFSLYSGANILTAKATKAEQALVPHKMIDVLPLDNTSYTVNQYTVEAVNHIKEAFLFNRVPIVVGGTNYYLDALLFSKANQSALQESIDPFSMEYSSMNKVIVDQILLKKYQSMHKDNKDALYTEISDYLSKYSTDQLNDLLKEIDGLYANFLHQNNLRRVINVIAYYFAYNKKKSDEINAEVKALRYGNNTKVIVLSTKHFDLLENRIKGRVNEMLVDQGGLAEIFWLFNQFNKEALSFTNGVLQAIGYKEFYPLYAKALECNNMKTQIEEVMSNSSIDNFIVKSNKVYALISSSNDLMQLFNQCKDDLIKNTVKYAKYQVKWIKKKILPFIKEYLVIDIEEFTKGAYAVYLSQAEAYAKSPTFCQLNNCIETKDNSNIKLLNWKRYHCDICNSEMNGESEKANHYKSHTHKKKLAKSKKTKSLN